MEILYFDKLNSTQSYLLEKIKNKEIDKEVAIVTKEQINGIGSRQNGWISSRGDLTFSFAIKKENLPKDLMLQSASIYFAYLFKEILHKFDNECWLKWPNDIYKKNKKLGGVITQIQKNYLIVGIGLNLVKKDEEYAYLSSKINVENMLNSYFMLLKKRVSWQEVFRKFKVEFYKNRSFKVHIAGELKTLKNVKICDDGALLINNERIYSLR